MAHEGTVALVRYWNRLRDGRPAPRRTEIEPADIKSLLADTFILERDVRGEAIFRLAGTRLCATYGRELKGYSFPLIWSLRDQRMIARLVHSAFREHAVVEIAFRGVSAAGRTNDFDMLLLPLEGGLGSARCLGSITPVSRPYWLGADAIVENCVDTLRVFDPDREEPSQARRSSMAVPPIVPGDAAIYPALSEETGSGRRVRHLVVFDGGREG